MAHPATPWLGVLQVEIGTPWARSLKEKRALLLPLLTRWRDRESLSVARLEGLDVHDREVWAVATVATDAHRARSVLERVRDEIADAGLRLRAARLDLEPWDPLEACDAAAGPAAVDPAG